MQADLFRWKDFQVKVEGFRFPVSGLRLPASGFRFPVSGLRLTAYGLRPAAFSFLQSDNPLRGLSDCRKEKAAGFL
jgi:hypothetical protein